MPALLLSIGLPVYQGEALVERSLNSILTQEFPEEIAIVDNASTDNTRAICESYARRDL